MGSTSDYLPVWAGTTYGSRLSDRTAPLGPLPRVPFAQSARRGLSPTDYRRALAAHNDAPNSAATLQQPVPGGTAQTSSTGGYGGYVLRPGVTETSHHVATDGKGGLMIVVSPRDLLAGRNQVILNSVKIHEGSHLLDALNQNNAIGNDQPAGIVVGVLGAGEKSLTELTAIAKQLTYIDKVLSNPGSLTTQEIREIQYYRVHVTNYRNQNIGMPPDPMPPYPYPPSPAPGTPGGKP